MEIRLRTGNTAIRTEFAGLKKGDVFSAVLESRKGAELLLRLGAARLKGLAGRDVRLPGVGGRVFLKVTDLSPGRITVRLTSQGDVTLGNLPAGLKPLESALGKFLAGAAKAIEPERLMDDFFSRPENVREGHGRALTELLAFMASLKKVHGSDGGEFTSGEWSGVDILFFEYPDFRGFVSRTKTPSAPARPGGELYIQTGDETLAEKLAAGAGSLRMNLLRLGFPVMLMRINGRSYGHMDIEA